MTAWNMMLSVLSGLGEDNTDSATITKYKTDILNALNLADMEICSRALFPYLGEELTLTAGKIADLTDLTHDWVTIDHVAEYEDYSTDASGMLSPTFEYAKTGNDTIYIPDATASGTVWVYYQPAPTIMTAATVADTSAPEYTPARYHQAYIYRGISEICATPERNQPANAATYANMYEDILSQIEPLNKQTSVTSWYSI